VGPGGVLSAQPRADLVQGSSRKMPPAPRSGGPGRLAGRPRWGPEMWRKVRGGSSRKVPPAPRSGGPGRLGRGGEVGPGGVSQFWLDGREFDSIISDSVQAPNQTAEVCNANGDWERLYFKWVEQVT